MVLRNHGSNNFFDAVIQEIIEDEMNDKLEVKPVVISDTPQMVVLKVVEYFFDARKPCPVCNAGKAHSIAYGILSHPINYRVLEKGSTVSVKHNSITLTVITETGCNVVLNGKETNLVWGHYLTFPLHDCTDVFHGIDVSVEPLYEKPLSSDYSCDVICHAFKYNLNDPAKKRTYLPEKVFHNVKNGDILDANWGIVLTVVAPFENHIVLHGCNPDEIQWDDTITIKGTPYSNSVECLMEVTVRKFMI